MVKSTVKFTIPEEVLVDLSPMTKKQILDNIEDATLNTLSSVAVVDWDELRNQAIKFLSTINALDNEYVNFTTKQLQQVTNKPEIASYVNNVSKQKANYYTQSLYMLAFQFDDYLSNFRQEDKERRALYVFMNKETGKVESYDMDFKELVLNSDKHGRLPDISKVRLQNNNRQSLEEQGLFNDEHIQEAQIAYNGILNRLERYYEVHQTKQKQGGLLLWKEQRRWMIGSLLNTGDLKEAYAAYLFSEHEKNLLCMIDKGNPPYYNHEFIGTFFKNYVTQVTNLEAIVEEDVLTTDKQYGIKGKKASLPSLQQYVTVASYIVQRTSPMVKQEVEEAIRNIFKVEEGKGQRNIVRVAEDVIEMKKITKEEMKKIERTLNS